MYSDQVIMDRTLRPTLSLCLLVFCSMFEYLTGQGRLSVLIGLVTNFKLEILHAEGTGEYQSSVYLYDGELT